MMPMSACTAQPYCPCPQTSTRSMSEGSGVGRFVGRRLGLHQAVLHRRAAQEDLVEGGFPGTERRSVVLTRRGGDGRHGALLGELGRVDLLALPVVGESGLRAG